MPIRRWLCCADPSRQEQACSEPSATRETSRSCIRTRSLMPKRRAAWSSWNYLGTAKDQGNALSVTYWMNRAARHWRRATLLRDAESSPLGLPPARCIIAKSTNIRYSTLPRSSRSESFPSLQGKRNTWFCGAYFGAGFHEDGLASGLAVAEALGGATRPWHAGPTGAPATEAQPDAELVSCTLSFRALRGTRNPPSFPAATSSPRLSHLLALARSRRVARASTPPQASRL